MTDNSLQTSALRDNPFFRDLILEDAEFRRNNALPRVAIVSVDPVKAAKILACNFTNNRPVSKMQIKRFVADMKENRWTLGNDALVISEEGELVNGQHRLRALIASGTTQPFLMFIGASRAAIQLFDLGRKRTMEERLAISGVPLTKKECAAIRGAMSTYSNSSIGTLEYYLSKFDDLVAQTYLAHKEFLKLVNADKPSGSSIYFGVALKMYAEMKRFGSQHVYSHEHSPLTRCQLFLDICLYGQSQNPEIYTGVTESAAFRLVRYREDFKHKTKAPFATKQAWRLCVSAAYKFMLGQSVKSITVCTMDPFHRFLTMPSTNGKDYA